MNNRAIAVYGSGGSGREVAWLAQICGFQVLCFIDDDSSKIGRTVNEIPVMSIGQVAARFPNVPVAAGIGCPSAREAVIARVVRHQLVPAALVHPGVERSRWVTFGTGVVICAGSILTTNIIVGDHVQINVDCSISHDVHLGDYATLAPGVHVSGFVTIGKRVQIGTGAAIINGTPAAPLTIGDDVVVGAGACVTRSVEAGLTVVGVPARPIARQLMERPSSGPKHQHDR